MSDLKRVCFVCSAVSTYTPLLSISGCRMLHTSSPSPSLSPEGPPTSVTLTGSEDPPNLLSCLCLMGAHGSQPVHCGLGVQGPVHPRAGAGPPMCVFQPLAREWKVTALSPSMCPRNTHFYLRARGKEEGLDGRELI